MFYLGSIAGILPYILAFSLTLVWGGHASLPFFTSGSNLEPKNEIIDAKQSIVENSTSFTFDNQYIAKKIAVFQVPFYIRTKVFNFWLSQLFDFAKPGISLLRAPPVSLF